MEKLLTFEQYNKQLNEGWKENILVGLLSVLGVSTMAGNKNVDDKKTVQTHLQTTAESFIKQGWSLDSTQVDSIFTKIKLEKPDTMMMVSRLQLDKNQYFESGKFILLQNVKDSIYNSMINILNDKGIITDIVVTSSTDKQGLSVKLQTLLTSLGYTADNQGLSDARNDIIRKYLTGELNVNDTLITSKKMFEQGNNEIDQSARFVNVDIYYMQVTETIKPEQDSTSMKINKTFFLSKDKIPYKSKHIRGGGPEPQRLGPVNKFSSRKSCWNQ